jgi:signal transduction histidine kinase
VDSLKVYYDTKHAANTPSHSFLLLGHIVNDILTLSRMQLHMLTLQESVFPLIREVRQVCSILINEMKSKGIAHTLEFGDSVRSLGIKFVSADKVRFGQVRTYFIWGLCQSKG